MTGRHIKDDCEYCKDHEEIRQMAAAKSFFSKLASNRKVTASLLLLLTALTTAIGTGVTYLVSEGNKAEQVRADVAVDLKANYIDRKVYESGQASQDTIVQLHLGNIDKKIDSLEQQGRLQSALLYKIAGKLDIKEVAQ
jgi:hypothetical protein